MAEKSAEVEEKALNYDDTKQEDWIKTQEFRTQLSALFATIEDNWYEKAWGELSGEEALLNIKASFDSFISEHEKLLIGDSLKAEDCEGEDCDKEDCNKSLKGTEEMVTKNTEENTVTPEEEVEASSAEVQEEVAEETKEEIPEEEVTIEEPVEAQEVAQVEEPKEQDAPAESEEVQEVQVQERTFNDLLEEVSGIKVDSLTEDELEKVYEAFSDVTEQIEAMVREELKSEIASSTAA